MRNSNVIEADIFRYFGNTSLKTALKCFIRIPAVRYSVFLRLCSLTRQSGRPLHFLLYLVARFCREHYEVKYGYQLSEEAIIGHGLYLGHSGGVVINRAAQLGRNVNISLGVVIGQCNRGSKAGVPRVGNCVWLGAHAVIVGNITIGNDVLIAPNAYVTQNLPDHAVAAGNPAQIVSYNGTEHYIQNRVGPCNRRCETCDSGNGTTVRNSSDND